MPYVPDHDYGSWPSPFDASGVQFAWDSVSLGTLKTCARKYQLSLVQNWQTKSRSHHLDFGIFYHSAIEHYHKMMLKLDARNDAMFEHDVPQLTEQERHEHAVRSAIRKALIDSQLYTGGLKKDKPDNAKTRWNLIRSLVWYFEKYGLNDKAKPITINGRPAVELSFRFEVEPELFLCGHLDTIVEFGGKHYILDHKTTSHTVTGSSGIYYSKQFNPDNQMTLYSLGAQVAFGTPVVGVMIDAAQIAVEFTEFSRFMTHRNQAHLDEFLLGLKTYRQMAEYYAKIDFYPMNETACGNYGGCEFRDICARGPQVRSKFLETDFTQSKPWNPLEPR